MKKSEITKLKKEIKKTGRWNDFKGLIPPSGYKYESWMVTWTEEVFERYEPPFKEKSKIFKDPFKALKFALTIPKKEFEDAAWSSGRI